MSCHPGGGASLRPVRRVGPPVPPAAGQRLPRCAGARAVPRRGPGEGSKQPATSSSQQHQAAGKTKHPTSQS
eukprot:352864-Chlamydomonas_euryale.AAC.3